MTAGDTYDEEMDENDFYDMRSNNCEHSCTMPYGLPREGTRANPNSHANPLPDTHTPPFFNHIIQHNVYQTYDFFHELRDHLNPDDQFINILINHDNTNRYYFNNHTISLFD